MKRIDLTGKKVGRLKVLGYSHSHKQPSGQKRAFWDVVCECGNKKKMSTSTLSTGTVSCGCYWKEISFKGFNKIKEGEANFNYKYLAYKHQTARRGIEFLLSKEDFRKIIILNCHYCLSEPTMHHVSKSHNGAFISNGIDRINSSSSYSVDNCVPCCKNCNIMKGTMSKEEFKSHVFKIIKNAENW